MGFEIVRPNRHGLQFDPLTPGVVSVSRCGGVTICTEDLESLKVTDGVVLLADKAGGFRLAMRAPRDGEGAIVMSVRPVVRKKGKIDPRRRRVNLCPAIRDLGLEIGREIAGRYRLHRKKDDGLLILDLSEPHVKKTPQGG